MCSTAKRKIILFAVFSLFILMIAFFAGAEQITSSESLLDAGVTVNTKMKSLAEDAEKGPVDPSDKIRAIRMAESLPAGFVPSQANTVSAEDSEYPVYIFFDNENEAGIMYFYTEGDTVVINSQASLMFAFNTALTDISGIAGWDASRATEMYGMFASLSSLTDAAILANWDTSSAASMRAMFSNDFSLMRIDVSNWDTGNVMTMANMFQVGENWKGNGQLTEIIGLGNLDVSNVRDMTSMFYGAGEMTSYDIGNWDVSKVESMNHMFCDNTKLRSLDLSHWNVSNLKTVCCMFDDNHSLLTIGDISHWNTGSLVDASGFLADAISFVGDNTGTLDLSGWDTKNMKAAVEMFNGIKSRTINLSGWSFDAVTNSMWEGTGMGIYYETGNSPGSPGGLSEMFKDTYKLTRVIVSQSTMDSFQKAVKNGVNTQDMWSGSKIQGFTVK